MAVRFDADAEDYTRAVALGTISAYTVSCWVKISTDRNTFSTAWALDASTSDNICLQTDSDGTSMSVISDGNVLQGMGGMTVGTWYWLCLAMNGTTGTLYSMPAGGAITATAISGATNVNAAILRIGESVFGSEWINGCVAAFKIWTAILTAAEAENEARQYLPARYTNLLAFYHFLNAGTVDYSGNGQVLSGGAAASTEDGPPLSWGSPSVLPTGVPAAAGGGPVSLDGTSSGASSASGGLDTDRPLTGIGSAAAAASGQLSAERPLTGSTPASAGATADLSTDRPLAGASSAAALATAALDAARSLTGSAAAAAHLTATLTLERALSGTTPAAAALTGALDLARPLAGLAASASSAAGELTVSGVALPHPEELTLTSMTAPLTLVAIPDRLPLTAIEED